MNPKPRPHRMSALTHAELREFLGQPEPGDVLMDVEAMRVEIKQQKRAERASKDFYPPPLLKFAQPCDLSPFLLFPHGLRQQGTRGLERESHQLATASFCGCHCDGPPGRYQTSLLSFFKGIQMHVNTHVQRTGLCCTLGDKAQRLVFALLYSLNVLTDRRERDSCHV